MTQVQESNISSKSGACSLSAVAVLEIFHILPAKGRGQRTLTCGETVQICRFVPLRSSGGH